MYRKEVHSSSADRRLKRMIPPFATACFILLISAVLGSCKNDSIVDYPELPGELIPLAQGNSWTYIDSTFSNGGVTVDTFTVSVISTREINGTTVWTLNNTFNPSITSRDFYGSSDSTYSMQEVENQNGTSYVPSLEYIYPDGSDSTQFISLVGGDAALRKNVTLYPTIYAGPTGSFSSFLKYWYTIFPVKYTEIVAPSIGVYSLRMINSSSDPMYSSIPSRSFTLLSYTLY